MKAGLQGRGFRTWFWPNRFDAKVEDELRLEAEADHLLGRGGDPEIRAELRREWALEHALRDCVVLAVAEPVALGLVFALWSSIAGWIAAGVVFGSCVLRTGITGLDLRKARRLRATSSPGIATSSERLSPERQRLLN
jgi:hypothetical protein